MYAALLALSLAPAAPALKPPPHPLAGEWAAVRFVVGGFPEKDPAAVRYRFTADGRWVVLRDGKVVGNPDKGYVLQRTTEPPAIDLLLDPAAKDGARLLGIYKLDGDNLTICMASERQPRPAAFESLP